MLHGDLHHDNLLRASREPWVAIDPHGLIGDPGYDIGALLFNPDLANRDPALTALVPSRLEQLADELAIPRERLAAWGFVKAVMSDVWSAESWSPAATWSPASRALDVTASRLPPAGCGGRARPASPTIAIPPLPPLCPLTACMQLLGGPWSANIV